MSNNRIYEYGIMEPKNNYLPLTNQDAFTKKMSFTNKETYVIPCLFAGSNAYTFYRLIDNSPDISYNLVYSVSDINVRETYICSLKNSMSHEILNTLALF